MSPETQMMTLATALVATGMGGAAATFVLHPLWVRAIAFLSAQPSPEKGGVTPSVSIVIAFRGGGALLDAKVANLLAQEYPADHLQVILVSDGPDSGDVALPDAFAERGWLMTETKEPVGKNAALNHGVERATGDILVFSDLDASLEPSALANLVAWFSDPNVGGVCGRRVVGEVESTMDEGQAGYVAWDSWVKAQESRMGFVTSGDGKLYAIRRDLFTPLPGTVTDDSFNCLTVVGRGKRIVFDPTLRAFIPKPSRSVAHELPRRRRVTARSLHGIFLNRRLLNPFRFGTFSIALLLNKVFRRLLPLFLLLVLVGSVVGATVHLVFAVLLGLQAAGLGLAALHVPAERMQGLRPLRRITGLTFYFLIGNLGMALGVIDFLMGRRVSQWTPKKTG